jgi:hypothetical protein
MSADLVNAKHPKSGVADSTAIQENLGFREGTTLQRRQIALP